MEKEPSKDEQRRWPEWAAAGAIVAAFCGLVLWGLEWGLPSRERARLEGSSARAKELSPELVEQSWRIWGSRGRRSEVADMFPRHVFNPLRSYHPDEYQVFKSLSNMRPGRLDFDPKNYIYPSLHTYLVGATEGLCSLLGVVRLERDVRSYFDHPERLARMYLVGRALTLLAAAGTLLLVWRIEGGWSGVLAMGLLAAMPAFGVHSHHLTRDTLTGLVAVVLFVCCRKVAGTGAPRWFDLAGAAAGLLAACQYFAAALWVLVPLAGLLWHRRERESGRAVATGVATSLVVMLAAFALACPYHLLRADRFLADFASETTHVSGGFFARVASLGWLRHLPGMAPAMLTWPIVVAVALGIAWAVVRREDADWLLLAWLAVWAAVVGYDGRAYSRYYVGLLPALALLAARGLTASWDVVRGRVPLRWARGAVAAVVFLALFGPAAAMSWGWAELYATENVRTIAGDWIHRSVPPGARIGVTQWPWQYEMPPIDATRYRLVVMEASPRRSPYDLARLWAERPEFFVTSSIQCGPMPWASARSDEQGRFWRSLFAPGQLYRVVRRFEVAHRFLGADLSDLPEDMRYVNPIIYVLELRTSAARCGQQKEKEEEDAS